MKLIRIKKVGNNKYVIELEGSQTIKTYDTVILKYQLLLKKEISEEILENIEKETKEAEYYQKTLQFMERKLRSKKEVEEFLIKQGVEDSVRTTILEKLKEQGMFQEKPYIIAYVHDRMNFSNDGPNKIRNELLKQGFDIDAIEQELEQIDEQQIKEKALRLITKKVELNHRYSESYLKQKLLEQMSILGYSKSLIQEILENQEICHSDILKKEAYKMWDRFKNKKSKNELFLTVRQKLYQKGYPMNEIIEVLEQLKKEND